MVKVLLLLGAVWGSSLFSIDLCSKSVLAYGDGTYQRVIQQTDLAGIQSRFDPENGVIWQLDINSILPSPERRIEIYEEFADRLDFNLIKKHRILRFNSEPPHLMSPASYAGRLHFWRVPEISRVIDWCETNINQKLANPGELMFVQILLAPKGAKKPVPDFHIHPRDYYSISVELYPGSLGLEFQKDEHENPHPPAPTGVASFFSGKSWHRSHVGDQRRFLLFFNYRRPRSEPVS